MTRPAPEQIATERFCLEPLSPAHAAEMVAVLSDASLYEFIGGAPPTGDELERRYATQYVGQPIDGSQWWFNWIVRRKSSGLAIGFVQATVHHGTKNLGAELAWVVAPEAQGRGAATEAAQAMISWLRLHNINTYVAFVHPEHRTSISVAKRLGLAPTSTIENGETQWESATGSQRQPLPR